MTGSGPLFLTAHPAPADAGPAGGSPAAAGGLAGAGAPRLTGPRVPRLTSPRVPRLTSHASAPPLPNGLRPAAILGVPLDRTTSYRSGTGSGPAEIRSASWSLETYSPALDADLTSQIVYDFGDLGLQPDRGVEAELEAIEAATAGVAARGYFPVVLGGEHLLTLATFRGVARSQSELATADNRGPAFLHFDAHADLREEYEGLVFSHATVVRHVAEAAGPRNVYQFGVRSGEREEMLWGGANVNRIPGTLVEATREALRAVAGRRVYCSVDIDIFDPAHAPGTGSPEPGGPPAADVFEAVVAVGLAAALGAARGGVDLVGFDLVEVSPPLDPSGRTNVLAAKLLREFLIARAIQAAP